MTRDEFAHLEPGSKFMFRGFEFKVKSTGGVEYLPGKVAAMIITTDGNKVASFDGCVNEFETVETFEQKKAREQAERQAQWDTINHNRTAEMRNLTDHGEEYDAAYERYLMDYEKECELLA